MAGKADKLARKVPRHVGFGFQSDSEGRQSRGSAFPLVAQTTCSEVPWYAGLPRPCEHQVRLPAVKRYRLVPALEPDCQ